MFHSLRHTSVTYKLKLNGGDIKAVQGDSGHSQINMVTDVYSHIIDDDRRKNAELFEEAFYEKKDLDPSMHAHAADKTVELPTDVDAELLAKVLSNPKMAAKLATIDDTKIYSTEYYRIYVKNYIVYYVVIDDENPDKIMEVRRFLYNKQNQKNSSKENKEEKEAAVS